MENRTFQCVKCLIISAFLSFIYLAVFIQLAHSAFKLEHYRYCNKIVLSHIPKDTSIFFMPNILGRNISINDGGDLGDIRKMVASDNNVDDIIVTRKFIASYEDKIINVLLYDKILYNYFPIKLCEKRTRESCSKDIILGGSIWNNKKAGDLITISTQQGTIDLCVSGVTKGREPVPVFCTQSSQLTTDLLFQYIDNYIIMDLDAFNEMLPECNYYCDDCYFIVCNEGISSRLISDLCELGTVITTRDLVSNSRTNIASWSLLFLFYIVLIATIAFLTQHIVLKKYNSCLVCVGKAIIMITDCTCVGIVFYYALNQNNMNANVFADTKINIIYLVIALLIVALLRVSLYYNSFKELGKARIHRN